jgi:Biotin-requiring enzyme
VTMMLSRVGSLLLCTAERAGRGQPGAPRSEAGDQPRAESGRRGWARCNPWRHRRAIGNRRQRVGGPHEGERSHARAEGNAGCGARQQLMTWHAPAALRSATCSVAHLMVQVGDVVEAGQKLMVLEAMKVCTHPVNC